MEDGLVLTVAEVAKRLRASRTTVYELIREGKIPTKKLGRSRGLRITVKAFNSYLDSPDNAPDNL